MTRRRRNLVGLLIAEAVSLSGTRLSAIAIPWFVLVTTGSATTTGLVAFAEMAPYVVCKALGGPLIDRAGQRRVSVWADSASALVVGVIPLLHLVGMLPFWSLLVLVAVAGALRGPGDTAKSTMVPAAAEAAGTPLERATGLSGTIDRLSQTVGPLLAGVLVALLGPLTAVVIDAASFALAAALIALTAPRRDIVAIDAQQPPESYLSRLRIGFEFLRSARLLRAVVLMIAATNMIDAATSSVLLPVWARHTGGGPAAVGALGTAAGVTAVVGSILATGIAHRLPRRPTYLTAFLIGGAPRIAVLALDLPLWVVITVWGVSGLALGVINPILSTTIFERIPRELLGRVSSLTGTVAFAGIPLGGLAAGLLVTLVGPSPAVLACAVFYFAATTLPALRPEWREMDGRSARTQSPQPQRGRTVAGPGPVG